MVVHHPATRFGITKYGSDDRRDLCRLAARPPYAGAVAALFQRARVEDDGDGRTALRTLGVGVRYGLDPAEPFFVQPSGAFASGFLVAPDLIATAGHCVAAIRLEDVRFVFGFEMQDATTARVVVPSEDVYRAARIVALEHDPSGPDWALIELDRPASGREPAPVRRQGRVPDGQRLYVLGHPCGIPLKYADNAAVRENGAAAFFTANLDTYAGSSGSPVFNADDHVVEGVLSRGARDFVLVSGAYRSATYPDDGGRGEDCTRTTEFSARVPG